MVKLCLGKVSSIYSLVKESIGAPGTITDAQWGRQAIAMHHWMLASAETVGDFRAAGFKGEVGLSLPLLRRLLASLDVAWTDLWGPAAP